MDEPIQIESNLENLRLIDSGNSADHPIRTKLPEPMIAQDSISVWSILKQCVGKELSKITMPVVFNEPLSFLQRIVEYLEYSWLLTAAASCVDPVQRMEFVAAFAISASSSNWKRLGKPFNPLLGETYELERKDLGLRVICEQVSHHPPVSAFHAKHEEYEVYGAIMPKLKFWGKSVEITPKGTITLKLHKYNEVYTWQNVNCCVNNIIVGNLWIEHYGSMEIVNHQTKHKALLTFKRAGWTGRDVHKVEGRIENAAKEKCRILYGKWNDSLFSYPVEIWEEYQKNKPSRNPLDKFPTLSEGQIPVSNSNVDLCLDGQRQLWQCAPRPDYAHQYYSFTLFAMMLNDRSGVDVKMLPRSDCRLRPDVIALEQAQLELAAQEKHRLEEKQRASRKERKNIKVEWKPLWFGMHTCPHTKKENWMFNEKYWSRSFEDSPDIF